MIHLSQQSYYLKPNTQCHLTATHPARRNPLLHPMGKLHITRSPIFCWCISNKQQHWKKCNR
jgi:hypothetical protein